jgi:anaerobic selenocysteine-containing dehydrogenase
MTTGRVVHHWHTRTKTGKVPALDARVPHAYAEIHPEDAQALGIELGDIVVLRSKRGAWTGPAMVVDTIRPGMVFVPFHFGASEESANQNTIYALDPVSRQPQLKQAAVRLEKVRAADPEPWLLERRKELTEAVAPFAQAAA